MSFHYGQRVAIVVQRFNGIGGEGEPLNVEAVMLLGTVASAWPNETLVEFDNNPGVPTWIRNDVLMRAPEQTPEN
jgi:hypothetical protein